MDCIYSTLNRVIIVLLVIRYFLPSIITVTLCTYFDNQFKKAPGASSTWNLVVYNDISTLVKILHFPAINLSGYSVYCPI